MLQLCRLDFTSIRAISRSLSSNGWVARERSLASNVTHLETAVSSYPRSRFSFTSFRGCKGFPPFSLTIISSIFEYSEILLTTDKMLNGGSLLVIDSSCV